MPTLEDNPQQPEPSAPVELVQPLPGNLGKGLRDNVEEDEIVEAAARTSAGEAIAVTDRRVLIIKAGFVTGAGLFGARTRSIPYSRIVAVDLRLGPLGGHLRIDTTGLPRPSDLTSFKLNNDENTVSFGIPRKPYMKRVAAIITSKVRDAHTVTVEASTEPSRDLGARLTELARIRDEGVLTEAEFEQAKARLLRGG